MEPVYIVFISVICGIFCLFGCLGIVFKVVRKKLENHIQQKFDPNDIVGATTNANFFGIKSKGFRQIRGNGALVLTREQICVVRALPFQAFFIPIDSVKTVSISRSFNGKTVFKELLCVCFSAEGREDAVAIAVDRPERWKKSIESIIEHR